MNEVEWNRAIDAFLLAQDRRKGEEWPADWPPSPLQIRGGIENRTVVPDLIWNYARAIGDPNPLWLEPDYARDTRWGGIIAPPTFENCVGVPYDLADVVELPGTLKIIDAGSTREYGAVIRPFDEFVAVDAFLGIEEQTAAKPYREFLQQVRRTYENQRGEKVATVTFGTTITVAPPRPAGGPANPPTEELRKPRYSPEELERLYRAYAEEFDGKRRRGAEVRYWNDVVVGEEIPSVIKGPVDDFDTYSYLGCLGISVGYAVKWASIKQGLAHAVVDPETGDYRHFVERYYSDRIAREAGYPLALAHGLQNEAIIVHGVTNWMGDDGFVKKLDLRRTALNYYGDMSFVKGRVQSKYVEDREHLVELAVWAECQDGRVHTSGTAVVRLAFAGAQ